MKESDRKELATHPGPKSCGGSRSNGLVYTRKRMEGQPFSARVTLSKGERSDLAEAGAQLM